MLLEGIVDIMTGEKKLHYPHFHGGYREDADFSCPIITELRNFYCNFAYGNIL